MEIEDDKMAEMRQTAVNLTADDEAARPQSKKKDENSGENQGAGGVVGKSQKTDWRRCHQKVADFAGRHRPSNRPTESQCHMDSTYFDMLFI